jgi:probable F420-dependent oxidoreductase
VTPKILATLDVLSGGRLVLGVGAGWMGEEFDLLGVPFEKRGARTSEYIRLYKALWTEDNPSFHGKFWQVDDIGFAPKPLQKPHPPIWVGGHSAPALKRAGTLADAWHAIGLPAAQVAADYAEVRRHAEAAGRDPSGVGLTIRTRLPLKEPAQAVEIMQSYEEIGVSHAVIEVFTLDLARGTEMMDVLASEVRPKV